MCDIMRIRVVDAFRGIVWRIDGEQLRRCRVCRGGIRWVSEMNGVGMSVRLPRSGSLFFRSVVEGVGSVRAVVGLCFGVDGWDFFGLDVFPYFSRKAITVVARHQEREDREEPEGVTLQDFAAALGTFFGVFCCCICDVLRSILLVLCNVATSEDPPSC